MFAGPLTLAGGVQGDRPYSCVVHDPAVNPATGKHDKVACCNLSWQQGTGAIASALNGTTTTTTTTTNGTTNATTTTTTNTTTGNTTTGGNTTTIRNTTIPIIVPKTNNTANVACTAADVTIGPHTAFAFVQARRAAFTPYAFNITNNCKAPGNLTSMTIAVAPIAPYTAPWAPFGCYLQDGVCQAYQNPFTPQLSQ